MHIVNKGNGKVSLSDSDSAKALANCLTNLDCQEPIRVQHIAGGTTTKEILTVGLEDYSFQVIGQNDAELVIDWLLTAGVKEVTVKRNESTD